MSDGLREINLWDYPVMVVSPIINLETFVVLAQETQVLEYVLIFFLKTLAKVERANHLKKMFGVTKLVNFVDLKTL